jgi:hypothetical protein
MTAELESAEELKALFRIEENPEYEQFTCFKAGVGFSVQRAYSTSCKYKPPVTEDGNPDTVALIRVGYDASYGECQSPQRVPLRVNICAFSRYLMNHFDYSFSDPKCPTEESVNRSKLTPKPVELEALDEYFIDRDRQAIVKSDGTMVSGIELLDELYQLHVKTVDTLWGQVFRWRMQSKKRMSNFAEGIGGLLKWALEFFCGRTLESGEAMRGVITSYHREDMKLLSTESIDVFGYRASKNTVGTFCAIILIIYFSLRKLGGAPLWLKTIAENSVLALAAGITSIAVLDVWLPRVLLWLINRTIAIKWKTLSSKTTFK